MKFGYVQPGQTIPALYSNLIRAPLFRHQAMKYFPDQNELQMRQRLKVYFLFINYFRVFKDV